MKILHVDSSILGDNSVTRRLSAKVVAELRRDFPAAEVVYHDLADEPLNHLTASLLAARVAAPGERSAEQELDLELSDRVLDEFLAADVIVVGAPMYNFTISSQLKAWIDRLAVAGRTFRYTADGPEGLAGGKKVIVVLSRGGYYGPGTPLAAIDFQEPYIRHIFGFFGITDIEFVRAEGVNLSPDHKQEAIKRAEEEILVRCAEAA